MKLSELISFLESVAPLAYQEDYDNSGLLLGYPETDVRSAIISLDCTEEIVDEAIRKKCKLIISHHPIIFRGIKKFTGKTYVERTVMKAIKNDIALYAIHTNFDNILAGVNSKICSKLGLKDCTILAPKTGLLKKLVTFCPGAHADAVRNALFVAGAGEIGNYSECSFNAEGTGTFKAGENTNAFVGKKGVVHREPEVRIEVIYSRNLENQLLYALKAAHPYEEVAYDLYVLSNASPQAGSGMIGELNREMDVMGFLNFAKKQFHAQVIRYTKPAGKKIKRVAVCGGSGSFLLPHAINAGADIFITGDYKYHDFFDAGKKIVIADVGHFESEQFTQELLLEIISKKFPNFALHLAEHNTNPINYLI
jgi:dinuclear metal center YbgI/SA1388 family protein